MLESNAPFYISETGWSLDALLCLSPNYNERPVDCAPTLLVIHNITLPPGQFGTGDIAKLFTNTLDWEAHPFFKQIEGLTVSAHFLIQRDGQVIQFVSTNDRAWHAGVSSFGGRPACNDYSVGIELEGTDDQPFENVQYQQLVLLTKALVNRHPLKAVTGHEHIAPGRKTDPGLCFDWDRYQSELKAAEVQIKVVTEPQFHANGK